MKAWSLGSVELRATFDMFIDYQYGPGAFAGSPFTEWARLEDINFNRHMEGRERWNKIKIKRSTYLHKLRENLKDKRVVRQRCDPVERRLLGETVAAMLREPDRLDLVAEVFEFSSHIRSLRLRSIPQVDIFWLNENKFMGDVWVRTVWHNEPWARKEFPMQTHVSENDPSRVAYTQNVDKLVRNIQTVISPGRYLKKFYGDVLSDAEIKMWADKQLAKAAGPELRFIDNDDPKWKGNREGLGAAWVEVYDEGPHSCMQGKKAVKVYGLPGNHLALAYWVDSDDIIVARTIVRNDEKQYVRCYSSDGFPVETFINKIEDAGYVDGDLDGIELAKIETCSGEYLMPYLDRSMGVYDNGSTFMVSSCGDYDCQNTSGYLELNRIFCEHCNGSVDEDDATYVEDVGYVCGYCLDRHYTHAIGRHGDWFWVPNRDVIQCETDGNYYVEYHAGDHGVYRCDECGAWVKDDLYYVYEERELCENCCSPIDHEDPSGNLWADNDEIVTLPDGTKAHRINADEFLDEDEDVADVQPVLASTDTTTLPLLPLGA